MKLRTLTPLFLLVCVPACQVPVLEHFENAEAQEASWAAHRYANVFATDFPGEIAIFPILDETSSQLIPMASIRVALRSGLLKRGFTPLADDFVDLKAQAQPASTFQLEHAAAAEGRIHSWDSTHAPEGRLAFDLEISFFDSQGKVLGNFRWQDQIKLTSAEYSASSPELRERLLLGHMMDLVLAGLPDPPPLD